MMTKTSSWGVSLLALSAALLIVTGQGCAGCTPENPDPDAGPGADAGPDGGPGGGGGDAGPDAGPPVITDAGCVASGTSCSGSVPCCSASCNAGVCGAAVLCAPPAAACDSNTDCCSGSCVSGTCSADRCNNEGTACSNGVDCCSGVCTGNVCQEQLAGACLALGSSCDVANDQCCSENCQGGVCVRASSCQPTNDVCYSDAECCSQSCTATGGNAGTCVDEGGRPGGCGYGGTPCANGDECCSLVCADIGTGQKVCQEVSGCTVVGDSCTADLQCCGGQPYGTVDCRPANFCDNGQACRAPGNLCGTPTVRYADGGYDCARDSAGNCLTFSPETNCCDGKSVKGASPGNLEATCRFDEVGVPRCFGGGGVAGCPQGYTGEPGCCIESSPLTDGGVGPVCNFSDQCCGGALCLEDAQGVRRCQVPQCIGLGESCTPGGSGATACCTGSCSPINEIDFACQNVTPGTDGGSCSVNGQSCSSAATCCSGVCDNGTCAEPPSCQPDGQACTTDAECCGTSKCITPAGSTTGTCQSGSTCPGAGQSCSPSRPCCGEGTTLICTTAAGTSCDGTTACTCDFIIGKPQGPATP